MVLVDLTTKQELGEWVWIHHATEWNVPQQWEKWLLHALYISVLQARFFSHISSSLPGEEHRSQSPGNSIQRCDSVGVPWPTRVRKVTLAIPGATYLFTRANHLCRCVLTLEEPEWSQHPVVKTMLDGQTESAPLLDSSCGFGLFVSQVSESVQYLSWLIHTCYKAKDTDFESTLNSHVQ